MDTVWDTVAPLIGRSLKYSGNKHTLQSIHESLMQQKSQLFIALDNRKVCFAWITEIEQYPTQKVLCVTFAGGKIMPFIHEVADMMERWAREIKCDAMEIYGRPGWEKIFKVKRTSVMLRKELGDKQ